MNPILEYPDLPAVVTAIDLLIWESKRCETRKERRTKITEANRLGKAYNEHCAAGGNHAIQFKQFV